MLTLWTCCGLCVCVCVLERGGGCRGDRKLLVYTRCLETLPFYCLGTLNKATAETIPAFVTFYILQADFEGTGLSLSTECTNKIGHFHTYIQGLKRKFQPQSMSFLNPSSFYTVVSELKIICLDSLALRPDFLYVKHSVSNVDSTSIFRSRIMKEYYVHMS